MKRISTRRLLSCLFWLGVFTLVFNTRSNAQCTWYGPSNQQISYGGLGAPPCSGSLSSVSNIGGGTYTYFTAYYGSTYEFSNCAQSYDTQLTIYWYNGSAWTPVAYDDDYGPLCSGTSASIRWTNTSGTTSNFIIIQSRYPCSNNDGISHILQYREVPPGAPSGNPSGGGGTYCPGTAVTLYMNSTPPTGMTNYWQTSASGTSTSIGSGSTLSASAPGSGSSTTYYVRTRSVSGCWGPASAGTTIYSYSTTNNPGAISLSSSSVCVGTTVNINNSTASTTGSPASSGPTYDFYWQNTADGVWHSYSVTSNNYSTVPSSVTNTAGSYMIARNSSWGCTGEVSAPFLSLTVSSNPSVGSYTYPTLYNCDNYTRNSSGTVVTNSVSGTTGTITWYWGSSNGAWNSWGTGTGAPGNCCFPVAHGSTDADRMRVIATNGACTAVTGATVLVTKNVAAETSVTLAASPICASSTTTVTANGISGLAAALTWYTGAGATGNNLGSSNPLTVGGNQTYYGRVTDVCGNAVEQSAAVNLETTNPGITAPASISINNSPNNSGNAAGVFASPSVSDNCSGEAAGTTDKLPLSSNLKLWIKADAGVVLDGSGKVAEWRDLSGNGNNLTQSTFTARPTKTASSASFNGNPCVTFTTAQYLKSIASLDGGANSTYTIFTVSRLNGGTNQRLISSASTNWLMGYHGTYKNKLYCNNWISNPSTAADASIHMYELTSNSTAGSGTILYDYGSQIAAGTPGSPNGPGILELNGYNSATEMSSGEVAEVIYYNTVLTAAQRQIVEGYLAYKYNMQAPLASMQAYQTFAAGATTVNFLAADQSGNTATATATETGTSYPGPTITPSATTVCTGTSINFTTSGMAPAGNSLSCANANDYLLVGTSSSTSNLAVGSNWTIETWFQYPLPANGGWNTLFRGTSYHHIIVSENSSSGVGNLGVYQGGFYGCGYNFNSQPLTNGWHHLAAVGTGGYTSFYIDGVFVGKSAAQPTDNIVAIGNYQGGGQYSGQLDEVRIWNTALSQNTISSYMTQGITSSHPNWANLVAYYKMDGNGNDSKSGTYPGTLQSSANFSSATAFYSYVWSGPGGTFSANNSTSESTTVSNPATGTYSVYATANSVNSAGKTQAIVVDPTSVGGSVGGGSTPICQGSGTGTMTLAGQTGNVVKWQKRVNAGAWSDITNTATTYSETPSSVGTWDYRAIVLSGVCASAVSSNRTIVVDQGVSGLTATASANPICEGSDLNLSASVSAGTNITYNWSGPGSYSQSNNQTPTRSGVLISNSEGTYTVSAVNACGTFTAQTAAVNVQPHLSLIGLTASANTPVCEGTDLNLTSSYTYSGGTLAANDVAWSWTGPNSFTANTQNATINSVTTAAGGASYDLVATNVCGSTNASTPVVQVTSAPLASVGSDVTMCSYDGSYTVTGASASNYSSFTWTENGTGNLVNDNTLSPTYNFGPNESGDVTLTLTANGNSPCGNAVASFVIHIIAPPAATASNSGPYTATETIQLFSSPNGMSDYSWSASGFSDNTQNPTRTNATVGMSGVYTVTVTDSHNCSATASTTVDVFDGVVWNGVVSSDWHNPLNWTPHVVPNSCGANVLIPTATPNMPIASAPATVKDMSVANNVTVLLYSDVSVCGNLTLGGTSSDVQSIGGSLKISGLGNQQISGTGNVDDLMIDNNNSAGSNIVEVTSGTNLNILHELKLNTGVFQNNGNTILVSSSGSRTAYINDFCATCAGTYSGNVTAQRKVDNGPGNDQHFLGVPVTGMHVSDFSDDVHTGGYPGYVIGTNPCSPNHSAYNSPSGHVFQWDETAPHPDGCSIEGWDVITNGNALTPGTGVSMYVPTGTTLDVTGPPVTGNLDVNNLSNSAQGYATDGWVLLSNPYPSTDNLSVSRLSDGFDNQVQVWETSGRWYGTYQQYSIASGVSLAPYQGFFVHVTNPGTKTWHFYQSERSTAQQAFYMQANDNTLTVMVDGNGRADKTQVGFNGDASTGFDEVYDADKFRGMPGVQTIYTGLQADRIMGINTLPSLTTTTTVPMGFNAGTNGQFTISVDGINSFDPTTYIYLEDKQAHTMTNLRSSSYTFIGNTTDNEDRFILHFTPPAAITTTGATCLTSGSINATQPGSANWNYIITDANNGIVATGVLNQNTPIQQQVPAGVYTLTLADNNGYTVVKNIQVNGTNSLNASFTASTTTVGVQQSVTFSNTTTGATNIEWEFSDGTIIDGVANPTYAFTEPGTYTVTLTVHNSDGCTSSVTQTITVTNASGIQSIINGSINVYSFSNNVVVDFSKVNHVDATIKVYNILGEEISNEKFDSPKGIYTRAIENIDAAYVLVTVRNNGEISTKKVFISKN